MLAIARTTTLPHRTGIRMQQQFTARCQIATPLFARSEIQTLRLLFSIFFDSLALNLINWLTSWNYLLVERPGLSIVNCQLSSAFEGSLLGG